MRTRQRTQDRDGFDDFVLATQQRLFHQAFLLTGDRQAAEDLVQSALVGLFVAWRRVDNPHAYVQRTLMHDYFSRSRRAKRGAELTPLATWVTRDHAPPRADEVNNRVTLLDALALLPPRMRAVVILRYWEDLSVSQTAAALRCTEGTVKSTASKALAHLRIHLGDAFAERSTCSTERSE